MKPSGYLDRPDYRVDLLRRRNRFQVRHGDIVIAESTATVIVDEQDHALMVYFPRNDVLFDRLVPMAGRTTHCPFKGDAIYWAAAEAPERPIAWSYESPYAQVAAIRDLVAFYPERVVITMGTAE